MVSNYVENEHPDKSIRTATIAPSIDDLLDICDPSEERGWAPNQSDLTEISAHTRTVHFSVESFGRNPNRSVIDIAEENLDNDLPLIVLVDAQLLRYGTRGHGPLHTVVIVGVGKDDVAIADPWFSAMTEVGQDKLEEAWDENLHQIINVSLRTTTNQDGGGDS